MSNTEEDAFNDEFFENYAKLRDKMEVWTEDNWEEEMAKHPFFQKESQPGEQSPLTDALSQLKYDPDFNSPLELMDSYREDGNQNFKDKKYKWAIASYTEGVKIARKEMLKNDKEISFDARIKVMNMVSLLYNNRASSQFYLQNYRSSIKDAKLAYGLNPSNQKAIIRVIRCLEALCNHQELIDYCFQMLKKNADILDDKRPAKPTKETELELQKALEKAQKELKVKQRDERKAQIAKMKDDKAKKAILDSVLERGIQVKDSLFETSHAAAFGHFVHFDPNSQAPEGSLQSLIWPVIFVYPDYVQTDFIQEFHELTTFRDHLGVLFESPPEWDNEKSLKADKLKIFIRDDKNERVVEMDSKSTLLEALRHEAVVVRQGVPIFMVAMEEPKGIFNKN